MKKPRKTPRDARGKLVRLGDRVRIIGMPDFSWITPASLRRERNRVFKHVIGQVKVTDDIDRYGLVGMTFRIRSGPDTGIHSIWLEPEFLLVQRSPSKAGR